jgi:hypothetical protein
MERRSRDLADERAVVTGVPERVGKWDFGHRSSLVNGYR